MFGDASKVAQQYQVSGNPTGHGFGLASGGLPPEGMLYGESIGTLAGMALALKTAGVADLRVSGPQANLVTCGFWGRYLDGMISSLTPQAKVAASEPWEGALYQYAAYGDQLRNWVEPDGMGSVRPDRATANRSATRCGRQDPVGTARRDAWWRGRAHP